MTGFEDVLEWLDGYWAQYRPVLHEDCLATTYASCGAVMLVAARVRTRSIKLIAALTQLPVGFVSEAVTSLERLEDTLYAEFQDLETTANLERKDYEDVRDALDFYLERLWMATDDGFADRLRQERGGIIVGGTSEDWLDREDLEESLNGLLDIVIGRRRRLRK